MFIYNDQYHYFESSLLKDLGVNSGFGTKKTPPIEDFVKAGRFVSMLQVHSIIVENIETEPSERITRIDSIDGLATQLSKVALLLKTADCVPVLYYDPIEKVIAATHQGWRGTLHNMAHVAIQKLVSCGCQVENIRVALGPAIGDCCNRLYDQRYQDFKTAYPDWFNHFIRVEGDDTYLSLPRLNVLQLKAEGISEDHIDIDLSLIHI